MTTAASVKVAVSGGRERSSVVLKDRVLGAWVKWTLTVSSRMSRVRGSAGDRGAGFVEYAGLMILIAGIYTFIDQLGLDGKISTAIGNAVGRVIG
ncbi:hypothetical protein AABC07_20550 [Streptomyces sp. LNU-CPARS28]